MPDLDIVNPTAPGWHTPYKLVLGGAEPVDVARAALRALTRSLRQGRGIKSLGELAAVAGGIMEGRLSGPDGLGHLHAIERASGGDRHTKVAAQAVVGIVTEARDEPGPSKELSGLVATRFCEELLAHYLYGPAWMEVLQERFPAPGEAQAFAEAVASIVEPRIQKIGEALVSNPEATKLRAPAIRRVSRRSTAELLDDTIDWEEG